VDVKPGRLLLTLFLSVIPALSQTSVQSKFGTISGTITDASTELPIQKSVITLSEDERDYSEKDRSRTAISDANGHYEFRDVRPGTYVLSADKPGFLYSRYGSRKSSSRDLPTPLTIVEDQTLSGIDIGLVRSAAISGKVVNEDGDPISNAHLSVLQYSNLTGKRRLLPAGNAESDDRGDYRIHGLAPGKYYVQCTVGAAEAVIAAADDKRAYPIVYYPNAFSVDEAVPITITPGAEETAGFNLVAVPSHTVRGKVIGADAARVQISIAQAASVSRMYYGSSATLASKDGSFELKNILPGTYWLTVHRISENRRQPVSKKIVVGDADLNNVVISFAGSNIEIHGTVHALGNTSVDLTKLVIGAGPGVGYDSDSDDGPMFFGGRPTDTKKDGSFTINFDQSSENLFLSVYSRFGGLKDWYLKSVFFGTAEVTDTGFVPAPGGELHVFVSPDGAQIQGVVTDKSDKPVPGAIIVTVPETSRRRRRDLYQIGQSDQLGHFQIRGVAPGNYNLFAFESIGDQPYYDPEFLKQHISQSTELEADEKGHYSVTLKLIPPDQPALPK
jgi:protocatechuate 3,4-dioxygenase beta subunit